MNLRYPLFASLVISLAAGCSSRDVDTRHSFRTFRENGIKIAETSGGPRFDEPLFRYEEILTLDQNEEVEASLLYRPIKYLMDEEGRFFVLDYGNRRVAVFDEGGTYSHSIGREGSGPGEFRILTLLSVRDGLVSVLDYRLQRVSVFDHEGGFLRHITFSSERLSIDSQVSEGPDGVKILVNRVYHNELRPKIVISWRVNVYSPDGNVISTVETAPVYDSTISEGVEASTGGYYLGQPGAVYVPDRGILITTGIDPVMEWYDLAGDHLETIRLNVPPEPVTAEERSATLSRLDQLVEEAGTPFMKNIREEQKRVAEIPEYKGYWCQIMVDEAGFIWARKPHAYYMDEYPAGSTYLIFSPEGEYLGDTLLPTGSGTVSRGHFLAIRRDADTGVTRLVVYRIHSAVSGLSY
ncbi:6-bladed beta-propeller [Gemmatimonadota bacterium]